jgi:predicted nucleic acid-binding protein
MKRYFVDSNILLRYFAKDEPKHSAAAGALFQKARDGEVELFCGPPVFFEVAWVLKSFYKLSDAAVLDILESILSIPHFTVFDLEYVTAAISLARGRGCGFADSYIAAAAADKNLAVATFNEKHFTKLGAELYQF